MKQYYLLKGEDPFEYLPLTFHIQKGQEDKEFKNFLKVYKNKEKNILNYESMIEDGKKNKGGKKKPRNIWIVKPGEVTNRGNGITVCDDLGEIKRIIGNRTKHSNGKERTYIVQSYLDRPFLYNKRKFDFRCYTLITQMNGKVRGYWYQEGYIRTSSYEFSLADCSDPITHLTNDAIQKYGDDFGKYEEGNKLSFQDFQRYLDLWMPDSKYNFFTDVYPQLKNITTDCVKATFLKLDPQRREFTFEVFGLDFMIDENFKAWLIECNTNPDITTSSPVLQRVIPAMVENALRIALDPIFPCPTNWPTTKRHLTPDNILEQNKFEVIFDESQDGPELRMLYKDSKSGLEGIKEMEEEEELKSDDEQKPEDEQNE